MGGKAWTEEELEIVKKHFDPLQSRESCRTIANTLLRDRTPNAVHSCASKLGVVRTVKRRLWEESELARLRVLADRGYSLPEIYKYMKLFWNRYRMTYRGIGTVRNELVKLGYRASDRCDLSIPEICAGLRCSSKVVYRWLRTPEFARLLNPIRADVDKAHHYIKVSNFKKFAKRYPGEIAATLPDIVWLVSILTGDE